MWDVNGAVSAILTPPNLFDLNYVGCEPITIHHGNAFFSSCLIWTMWDVNFSWSCKLGGVSMRLIWTMWDVNVKGGANMGDISAGLIWTMWDVNRHSSNDRWGGRRSLIWTMWDVNESFIEIPVILMDGLIWTMWDVNTSSVSRLGRSFSEFDLNYVGCEHDGVAGGGEVMLQFDLNYVGCELKRKHHVVAVSYQVWSELCGMWTSWEVIVWDTRK